MAKKTLEENINQAVNDFKAIKAKIVEKGVKVPNNTPTSAYPERVEQVYHKGVEDGIKSEYDKFWYEESKNYSWVARFAGAMWTNHSFKPKFDIRPYGNTSYLFYTSRIFGDLVEILDEYGVELDISKATSMASMFSYSNFTRIGVLDTRNIGTVEGINDISSLHTVDKIILKDDGSQAFRGFSALKNLVNIRFEGVIGQSGINFKDSYILSKESIINIVNVLSSTSSGKTITLSLTAVNNAFGGNTSQEWLDLVATKPNWTIALA